MRNAIPQNIMDALQDLPDGLQRQVIDFLQSVDQAAGQSWTDGGQPQDRLRAIREAYERDCGQVDFE